MLMLAVETHGPEWWREFAILPENDDLALVGGVITTTLALRGLHEVVGGATMLETVRAVQVLVR